MSNRRKGTKGRPDLKITITFKGVIEPVYSLSTCSYLPVTKNQAGFQIRQPQMRHPLPKKTADDKKKKMTIFNDLSNTCVINNVFWVKNAKFWNCIKQKKYLSIW